MRTALIAVVAGLAVGLQPSVARACGGCFSSPSQNPTVVTDHRMILSLSMGQTTLYDQIEYSGSPDSFAWVLPISGLATVGLSADVVFGALDSLTHTKVNAPPVSCPPPPPECQNAGFAEADASTGVQVITQQVVGPYETVQLKSSDPQALNNWLAGHGFVIPADVQPVIDAYVQQGSSFLAMKLVPGASVQSMRPVRVTTQGASPVLPLRMVAAGTGSTVGITLWVVAEGRYEPQNFPSFRIQDADLVWDWSTASSNYATVRLAQEWALGGRGWEIESSLALTAIELTQLVDYDPGAYDPTVSPDGGDAGESAEQVRADDLATLFHGIDPNNLRVTRLRSDVARAALDQDLTLQASSDQSELTNQRYPTQSIGTPQCPSYGYCPGPGYDDGGLVDPGFAQGGCNTARSNEGKDNLVAVCSSFLGLALYRVVRRRRNR